MDKPRWWNYGQHEYTVYAQALGKKQELEDRGETARIIEVNKRGVLWHVVQIFEV